MPASPGRQRLTPAHILLIVVVSVLVLLFVVLLMERLTGDGQQSAADASPTVETQTGASTATPGEDDADAEPTYFASPSGNIVCTITADSADCGISNFQYAAEDAASCESDGAGGHLRVEPAGASMPCDPLVVVGDVPVLEYGQTAEAHGYSCLSERSGVTCRHDESGHGFSVARASYRLF
ncbi:DUF6636 domain-containing protein [Georgenia sp. H159]|uniref:DUF6636 domain-containing protein n=1 Tax=Georgenia sp. H159 TaxID=3076115 RepID=UPI002D76F848|nr:DUF6636 domain-containing protein [Georgenia sp. H159]